MEWTHYGVDEGLREAVERLATASNGSSKELDRVIQRVGAHHVAHFLATTPDAQAAEGLKTYLRKYWPAYYELVDRLIRAARRSPENEDLQTDFGQS